MIRSPGHVVILVDKGCLIHDSYIFDNRPIGISSKRHPEQVSIGDLFKHSHSHFKLRAASYELTRSSELRK